MNGSRPTVHPVEAPPLTDGLQNGPRTRMKEVQGMSGTKGGLALRIAQSFFGVVSVCVMVSAADFRSVTAFCYLVIAVSLQTFWSLSLAVMDLYALLVGRTLRKRVILCLFATGDGITSTLTFSAACASAGITVLVGNDLNRCSVNHCTQFETATTMAFMC
ncbi:CASP-like protein 5A1 isoform X2 [Mercurialis annua]|nr:CASP-like protein 5A1 isoform X2 [Mercurialis annua]